MKAKGAAATVPPVVPVTPVAPVTAPAAPIADPQATPVTPATPKQPVKTALPTSSDYVPGTTRASDWKALKAERDAAIAERDALKSSAPPPELAKTLAEIKKERDDYQAQLRSIAIERDPAFDREFSTATASASALAKSTVGAEHSAKIDVILSMSPGANRDKAVNEIVESLPAYKQTMLGAALADLDRISFTKQAKIDEARANWSRLQQEASAQQAASETANKAKLEGIIKEWTDPEKGFAHLRHKTDDHEHNARVDGTLELARNIFSGQLDMEQMARASVWAASAEQLLSSIKSLQDQNAELEAQLAKFTGASPGAGDTGTGGTVSGAGDSYEPPAGSTYGQAIADAARKAGLLLR